MQYLNSASTYLWPFRQREEVKQVEQQASNLLNNTVEAFQHTYDDIQKIYTRSIQYYKDHQKEIQERGNQLYHVVGTCVIAYGLMENCSGILSGVLIESYLHGTIIATTEEIYNAWSDLSVVAKVATAATGVLAIYGLPGTIKWAGWGAAITGCVRYRYRDFFTSASNVKISANEPVKG